MSSFRARSSGALLTALVAAGAATGLCEPAAHAGPQRTWNLLTTGNGLGFQVYDTSQNKIVQFLDHPYRYIGPKSDPKAEGWPRRNLAYDLYFGIKGGGASGWLNAPTSAGDV